jgi:electron transport complex protein RnfB
MMSSPLARRDFLQKFGSAVAGCSILAASAALIAKDSENKPSIFWQIDPYKCTYCGRCETDCVLTMSAVKCVHVKEMCGYCDLCGGYYRSDIRELNTAAENLMCPTGAIIRDFVEDPYFEYDIDESLCTGCAKCVKGCSSFGNGSLFLQIKRELCADCNECEIAKVCPADAIKRGSEPYILRG